MYDDRTDGSCDRADAVDSTRWKGNPRSSENTGLGLFISHAIVTDHGGQMEVETELGSGTTIFVKLPLVSNEVV